MCLINRRVIQREKKHPVIYFLIFQAHEVELVSEFFFFNIFSVSVLYAFLNVVVTELFTPKFKNKQFKKQ